VSTHQEDPGRFAEEIICIIRQL